MKSPVSTPSLFTPGPWRWNMNPDQFSLRIDSHERGKGLPTVLRCSRWGMQGATLEFNDGSLMQSAKEFSKPFHGREHHSDWCRDIDHPDARLIIAAPDLYDALTSLVDACLKSSADIDNDTLSEALSAIEKANGTDRYISFSKAGTSK